MSADIQQFREAVQRFDELILELERTDDKLSNNFEKYITLSDTLSDSVDNQREIIQAISNLMLKGTSIVNDINTLNNNTKSINQNTINTIKKEFESFDNNIKNTMSSVVNSIDLSTFRRQVETLFDHKISSLESEVKRLNSGNDELDKLNTTIKTTLKSAKTEMSDSINEFNRLSKVVNWKVILSVLFGGMFAGALSIMFFDLNILKSQFLKKEEMALESYRLELEIYKDARGLQKFLFDNKIDIKYGNFSDTGEPYVLINKKFYDKSWVTQSGDFVVDFK